MAAKRILVVDDNRSIVKALELVLKQEGFHVQTAFDGVAALESINQDKPDLIILDIVMPLMNGYEVCRRLSLNPETKNIPVIMLTGTGDVESDNHESAKALILINQRVRKRRHAFDAGATEFFTKPAIANEIVMRVKQLLGLS